MHNIIGYLNLIAYTCKRIQHLEKMKSLEDVYGQVIALENIAKTYEYMANLTKACETLEQVQNYYTLIAMVER